MKQFNLADITKFCEKHERTVDSMIWKSVQANLESMKVGFQKMYSLFKMNKRDNAIYLMFVNVHRKDEENIHCDIISITRYDSVHEYNHSVELEGGK